MKFIIVLLGFFSLTVNLNSQVITTVFSNSDSINTYIPWYFNHGQKVYNAPSINVDSVLTQDSISKNPLGRISVMENLNYNKSDGNLITFGNYKIWKLTIVSDSAKSISVNFRNTYLPQASIMYIYNEETRFVFGPIDQTDFRDSSFRSDYIDGDSLKIDVFLPDSTSSNFQLEIESFNHGIKELQGDSDYNESGDCQNNVACPEANGWDCQISSVCKVIMGETSCTGSLVNNECCDLTPYILTADHCLDIIEAENLQFRFNYESKQCEQDDETEPPENQWITYYGSSLRSRWDQVDGTDFTLVEMFNSVGKELSFSGWKRTSVNSNNTTLIHHPKGDVKKIAFDDDSPTIDGNYLDLVFDDGVPEPGSSGSPLYNDSHKIIGQASAGSRAGCNDQNATFEFGRFMNSWTGNGTDDSRLSNWLGPNFNPQEIACMLTPYIEGDNVLCTDSKQYEYMDQLMNCDKDKNWTVTPTNLFGSSTSGNQSTISLWADNVNSQGRAHLSYELTSENCDNATINKYIWVGKPKFKIYGKTELCLNNPEDAFAWIKNEGNYEILDVEWTFNDGVTGDGNENTAKYRPDKTGPTSICATVYNECGSTEVCLSIIVYDCGQVKMSPYTREKAISVRPNPNNGVFNIKVNEGFKSRYYKEGTGLDIKIINTNGEMILNKEIQRANYRCNISNQSSGIYILSINVLGKLYNLKIIKI